MGECGCSSDEPLYRFNGNMGIRIYDGCVYCHTPVGVDIYRYDKEMTEAFLEGVPELPIQGYDQNDENGIAAIPIIEPKHLIDALKEEAGDDPELVEAVEAFTSNDWSLQRALQVAVSKTVDEHFQRTLKADGANE